MAKKLFFDLETTGVDPMRHGIHQISAAVEIDGELKEAFNIRCKPHPKAAIDLDALKVSNVTMEQLEGYLVNSTLAYKELVKFLEKYVDRYDKKDKFFLVGYNNRSFDDQFLRQFFAAHNDAYFGSWFWPNSIDVMVLATEHLIEDRPTMLNFKLHGVAKHLGMQINEESLHDAVYDLKLTRDIYNHVRKPAGVRV